MKKTIIVPFLLFSMFVFSQVDNSSKINFKLNNDGSITTDQPDLSKIKLPVKFIFSSNFKGKQVQFTTIDKKQSLAPEVKEFGDQNLQKDGEDGTFKIEIKDDRSINPGDNDKINFDNFILKIENNEFPISLAINTKTQNQDEPKKSEEYKAGYIYYDALKLLADKTIPQTKIEILKAYGVDENNLQNNPYLLNVLGSDFFNKNRPEAVGISTLLTSLGNTDVTYFVAGLARFLAERTKEELNEVFFNKMKEQLNSYPELITIFPQTSSFLKIIETYSYASVIQVLKEAFETDIHNLPENLYKVKSLTSANCNSSFLKDNKLTDCQDRLNKLSEFFKSQNGLWIGLGMFTVKEAIHSSNPASLLRVITESTELKDLKIFSKDSAKYDDYNVVSSLELGNFISQSLISIDDKQVWISSTELNSLFKTKDAFKVYLGLMLSYELREKDKVVINFYKSDNKLITFGGILIEIQDSLSSYEPQITSLIKNTHTAFNSANIAVKKMIAATDKSVEADPQALYDYYRTFTSSIKPIVHSTLLKTITGKDIGAVYNKVDEFLNPAVDIAYHISINKYSAAIYDASILLNSLSNIVDEKKNPVFKPVTKLFVKYGTLISTVANAQSSNEVKQALDASILPVGSFSIKRNTNLSLSINSYVGAYWSYANSELPSLGLSAPIGFNISYVCYLYRKCGGLSLNIQIIDVGALVNYYFVKGDTASLPNDFSIKLSNIFAPGFNLCYNVPKTPLSLAWGGQYIPTLYKYEQVNGNNELTPTNAWRWQLSLLIDIPLFNLKVWDFKK